MCLTVCRQRGIIYDNDRTLVCATCPLRQKQDEQASCETCQHYQRDAKRELCLMTGMGIPKTRWCCHYNAPRDLPHFPHRLNDVDGIVLVTDQEFKQALTDYLEGNPLIDQRYELATEDTAVELTDIVDDDTENGDDDWLWASTTEIPDISINDEPVWDSILHCTPIDPKGHRILDEFEAHQGIYVPISVGKELVTAHDGIRGVIEWFEAIFGGPEDISVDWRGRWIVHPHRLAVPGVYGVPAPNWSSLIEDDLTDLIHDLFS